MKNWFRRTIHLRHISTGNAYSSTNIFGALNSPTIRKLDDIRISVVSTSSRGIGLEFTRQLLTHTNTKVIALVRDNTVLTTSGSVINSLFASYPSRIRLVSVDLEDQNSIDLAPALIKRAAHELTNSTDSRQPIGIDLLLNVAGILGDGIAPNTGPERSVSKINRDWMRKSFEVNLFGTCCTCNDVVIDELPIRAHFACCVDCCIKVMSC